MASQKVKLEVGGSSYVVSTNDSEEYLLGLAERLDQDMNRIMVDTPNASVTAAAVITALGYLDEAEKNANGADNMRAQLQDYLEDAAKARMAAEELRREVDRLRRELAHFERKAAAKPAPAKAEPKAAEAKGEDKPPFEAGPAEEASDVPDAIPGQMGLGDL